MKMIEAWNHYQSDKEYLGYSPETLKAYHLYMKLFVKEVGDKHVKDYTYFEMKKYLADISKRLKTSSVIARMRFFKSFFRWAHDEGLTEKNEASRLKEPKLPEPKPKPLTLFEIESLRDACTIPLERAIFEFFYATGCRIGEVVRVNKQDLNWTDQSLIVKGKGNKTREVYFDLKCRIWLEKYLNIRNDEQDALFATTRKYNGQPRRLTIAGIRWIVKRIAKRAGITKSIYPHALRHSYAMNMLENGAPLDAIQEFLGHSDVRYTKTYAALTTDMKKSIYKKYHR